MPCKCVARNPTLLRSSVKTRWPVSCADAGWSGEAAEAVFLTGTGLPTLPVLEALEQDLGKPVISSASAMMWHALRLAGVRQPIAGYGRLLSLD